MIPSGPRAQVRNGAPSPMSSPSGRLGGDAAILLAETRPVLPPGLLVVGASTGGPQALVALLSRLAPVLSSIPVCVTLHMPRELMPVVAAHVAWRCRIETSVVDEPCRLRSGRVHFTPGDRHLAFERGEDGIAISSLPVTTRAHCRSAIDAMFTGAAQSFGSRTVGVVLSGMGEDGLTGARAIAAGGGVILVQDRITSAVWGMPGAVAKAGLASSILPPPAIANEVIRRLGGGPKDGGLVPGAQR